MIRFLPPRPLFPPLFSIRASRPLVFIPATPSPPSLPLSSLFLTLLLPPPSLFLRLVPVRSSDPEMQGLLSGVKWPAGSAARWALRLRPWAGCDRSDMLTMNLEGLEMIAVLVVVVLFVKVLERFGLLEAGYDGKKKAKSFFFFFVLGVLFLLYAASSHLLLNFKVVDCLLVWSICCRGYHLLMLVFNIMFRQSASEDVQPAFRAPICCSHLCFIKWSQCTFSDLKTTIQRYITL